MGGIFSRGSSNDDDSEYCLGMPPDELAFYLDTYPFSKKEIHILFSKFKRMCKAGSTTIEEDDLEAIEEMQANPFATRIMELFSEDGSGCLNFEKFMNLVTAFSEKTPMEVKLIWAFALWDFDGDDVVGDEDIRQGINMITSTEERIYQEEIFDNVTTMVTMTPEEVDEIVSKVQQEIDPDHYGLAYADFRKVLVRMPDFFQNFRMNFT